MNSGTVIHGNVVVGTQVGDSKSAYFVKDSTTNTQRTFDIPRPANPYTFYTLTCMNTSTECDLTVKVFNKRKVKVSGTATAGANTTITLATTSNLNDDYYNNATIEITSGKGKGQIRTITDYTGATRVATVAEWTTNPDATSIYEITFDKNSFITSLVFPKSQAVTGTTIDTRDSEIFTGLFAGDTDAYFVVSNNQAVTNNDANTFTALFQLMAYA